MTIDEIAHEAYVAEAQCYKNYDYELGSVELHGACK